MDAVDTQAQARDRLPAVRARMSEIGVDLAERVRVRVVTAEDIDSSARAPAHGVVLGLTDLSFSGRGRATVAGIRVVAGLPPAFFGQVVAHEIGHAWLAQYGHRRVPHDVEEGLSELFAYAWLNRERSSIADRLRARIRTNPDPVYGQGFRLVHAAVNRYGMEQVLTALLTTGELPREA